MELGNYDIEIKSKVGLDGKLITKSKMKAFYKDTNNHWVLETDKGKEILIAGTCTMYSNIDGSKVWIRQGNHTKATAVIEDVIKDPDTGDTYTDYDDFISTNADFFKVPEEPVA